MRNARITAVLAATALALLLAASTAVAHVQVKPTEVAPDDSVKFEVLVPGETSAKTVEVELAVPKDVIPFSFGETPGWKRDLRENTDGSIRSIVWTGEAPSDGFVEFSFLASTPAQPTTLQWKSIQTYSDGNIVRWIGSPESEYPASRTVVTTSAEPQSAGGSHSGGEHSHSEHSSDESASMDHGAWVEPVAIAALALALIAAIFALLAYRRTRE